MKKKSIHELSKSSVWLEQLEFETGDTVEEGVRCLVTEVGL